MIDLILYAANRAALGTWAEKHPTKAPLVTRDEEGTRRVRSGLEWSWWAGTGQFLTRAATFDESGAEITPATYMPGVVLRMRVFGEFFEGDRLTPDIENVDKDEQWARSKIAQYIKNNGTPGTTGGVTYYEIDGVRLFRPADVATFLASRGLPNHVFL